MLESTFSSVFGTAESLVGAVSAADFLLCCVFSVVLGAACAGVYMFRHSYSKNFVVTLALLPLIVQMVITLVNGNLGAGIAVMGVFNLVRFRSIPGSAKDIGSVFLAMAIGLATGMGFLGLACVFTVVFLRYLSVYYDWKTSDEADLTPKVARGARTAKHFCAELFRRATLHRKKEPATRASWFRHRKD